MTQRNISTAKTINRSSLVKSILLGAAIALVLILSFVIGAESQPHWPDQWRIRPLLITPLAGAFGGGLFYLFYFLLRREGFNKIATLALGLIGFLVVLWLGVVLGLDGTMWD